MTGLDCLRKEMKARGLTSVQVENKVTAVVLDIIAGSGNKYTEMWKEERGASKKLEETRSELFRCECDFSAAQQRLKRIKEQIADAEEHRKHCEDYIDEFNKSIKECETAEGRDAMRIAQMFVNSVDVNTKYDNTAYIIGLASILNGKMNAIEELRKINKKLPQGLPKIYPGGTWDGAFEERAQ